MPLGAYGPVRYTSSGRKSSLDWAAARVGAAMTSAVNAASHIFRTFIVFSFRQRLVRKRPQPELLFRDLPEPRQPARLDDQKEDDQSAEDHQLDLLLQGHRQREPD